MTFRAHVEGDSLIVRNRSLRGLEHIILVYDDSKALKVTLRKRRHKDKVACFSSAVPKRINELLLWLNVTQRLAKRHSH